MNSLAFKYRESLSSQKGTDISGALSNKNNYGGTQAVTKKTLSISYNFTTQPQRTCKIMARVQNHNNDNDIKSSEKLQYVLQVIIS